MRDLADELLQAKVKQRLFGGDHAPRLGRLVIVDRLGAGAMGTVFSAYDPHLDRTVAVKALRVAGEANQRVLAEARALARLAHPNVVAVHDAVELDGEVHIVMELAPGVPLRAWLAAPRDWRQILRVAREAGAGIAAAHRAGLVHRDIKPDNVLVGDDRARVVDFGLASAIGDDPSAGTPSYMAPEVLAGGPATARSDQWSFAVMVYEALHGSRPHAGRTRDELRASARSAAAARPPASRLPARIHAAIARALAADPEARFPSMEALLAALGVDRRRARIVAVASAALAFGAVAGALASRGGNEACVNGAARRAEVWNPTAKLHVANALGGAPWAASTLERLEGSASGWQASHDAVCRARGDLSDALFDLRMRCLDRALDRFRALTARLVAGDRAAALAPGARIAAASAVDELPPPESCEKLVDAAELALPEGPAERERARRAERGIDAAWVEFALGDYPVARARAAAIAGELAGIEAPAIDAERLALSAAVEARSGQADTARQLLQQALAAAAAAHTPELELEIWSRQLRTELFAGDPAHVLEWVPFARAAAARAGRKGAEIDGIMAEALRGSGKLDEARALLERALASGDPLRPSQRAILELNLGAVELAAGESGAAQATLQRARERVVGALGERHPEVALYLDKLAAAHRARGRLADARALHGESLALRIDAFGDGDRAVATSLLQRGQTDLEAGDLVAAAADLERAAHIRERAFGPASARLGEVVAALGDVEAARGNRASAAADYDHAAELDPRLDLAARRFAIGAPLAVEAIPPLDSAETLSVDRAAALAARVTLLERANRTGEARALAAALHARFRPDLDASLTVSIAAALFAAGDRSAAAIVYDAASRAAGDQPTRTALRATLGLARATDGERAKAAGRAAESLYGAMPLVSRAAEDAP